MMVENLLSNIMVFDRKFTFLNKKTYKCAFVKDGMLVFWGKYFNNNITRLYCENTKEYYPVTEVGEINFNTIFGFKNRDRVRVEKIVSYLKIDGVMKKGFSYSCY